MGIASPRAGWWKEPIHKVELIWIIVAFLWGLGMFFMMIYWHGAGNQNLSNEAYRITPAAYAAKVDKMMGRVYMWWPMLELVKGETYRLHLSSIDLQHGFSLQPVNINLQVHPGYESVVTMTPNQTGQFGIVCNEYCGFGHHTMTGRIYVVDNK